MIGHLIWILITSQYTSPCNSWWCRCVQKWWRWPRWKGHTLLVGSRIPGKLLSGTFAEGILLCFTVGQWLRTCTKALASRYSENRDKALAESNANGKAIADSLKMLVTAHSPFSASSAGSGNPIMTPVSSPPNSVYSAEEDALQREYLAEERASKRCCRAEELHQHDVEAKKAALLETLTRSYQVWSKVENEAGRAMTTKLLANQDDRFVVMIVLLF